MNSVERVREICKQRKVAISRLEKDLGFSNGYVSQLRKGTFPADRLAQIAEYFGTTTDYLLTGEEKAPTVSGERDVTFDDFTYAMFNEGKDLSDENKRQLLEMAKFFKQQQEKEKGI